MLVESLVNDVKSGEVDLPAKIFQGRTHSNRKSKRGSKRGVTPLPVAARGGCGRALCKMLDEGQSGPRAKWYARSCGESGENLRGQEGLKGSGGKRIAKGKKRQRKSLTSPKRNHDQYPSRVRRESMLSGIGQW